MGILDAQFEYGVLKVRYAVTTKKNPHAGEPVLNDEGEPINDEETGEPLTHPDTLPVNERYELCRLHPADFLFGEDAGPLEDSWPWVANRVECSKKEALDDPRLRKKAVKSIKGKRKENESAEKGGIVTRIVNKFSKDEDEDLMIEYWELYDLKKKEMLVCSEEADDLLLEPRSLPPGIDKHPYSILRFSLLDKSPYPIPPVSPAIDQQKEISLSRSRLMTHRKRFNRKYEVMVNNLVDPEMDMSKLESGDDGTIIPVNSHAIEPIKDAPLDQQNLQELAMLNNDMVETLGTGDNARGIASADSATEASLLDKRLEVREGDKLSMVMDWILEITTKLDQLVQAHLDKDEAVKVTGPQGESWETIKKGDYEKIDGEFEYSVNAGASSPRLPEIERAQWIAFMSQVIIPFPHILTAPAIMKRMAAMFGIEDEAAVEEFRQLGQKIMSGQMPMPGGGQGGGASNNPVAAIMGQAMGAMGGNTNGGGAPAALQ
jgi:hypothetical protein